MPRKCTSETKNAPIRDLSANTFPDGVDGERVSAVVPRIAATICGVRITILLLLRKSCALNQDEFRNRLDVAEHSLETHLDVLSQHQFIQAVEGDGTTRYKIADRGTRAIDFILAEAAHESPTDE
jgi:predicted transcriptional regulator